MAGFRWSVLVVLAAVWLGGCGSDDGDDEGGAAAAPAATQTTATEPPDTSTTEAAEPEVADADAAAQAGRPAGEEGLRVADQMQQRVVIGRGARNCKCRLMQLRGQVLQLICVRVPVRH